MKPIGILQAIVISLVVAKFARADIYQWKWDIDLERPVQSITLAPDGAGVDAVVDGDLSNRDLSKAYLRGANLSNALLTNSTFSSSYMPGAILSNANLSNSSFLYVDFSGATFEGANLNLQNLIGLVCQVQNWLGQA